MGNWKDIQGQKYGRLRVISIRKVGDHMPMALCLCDCGNEKVIQVSSLKRGAATSCGCFQREKAAVFFTKHGLKKHPLCDVWFNIKARCYDPKNIGYHNYGGRGITVCEEWMNNMESFVKWGMANGYQKGLDIDRRDNNGNYEPGNCRFVTRKVNCNNKRNNRLKRNLSMAEALDIPMPGS